MLAIFNVSEIRDLDLIEQHGFDEFWNNNGALWFRPHMLCNDKCEMFHWLTFTLGLKGKCVIIPHINLPILCIEDSSKVASLTKFWGIIIAKFYGPHEGIVCLFSSLGSFDCKETMVRYVNEDDTSITITKVLVWCCTPTLPSCEVCYKTIANFD